MTTLQKYRRVRALLQREPPVSTDPNVINLLHVLYRILGVQLGFPGYEPFTMEDAMVFGTMAEQYLSQPGNNTGDEASRMIRYIRNYFLSWIGADGLPMLPPRLDRQYAVGPDEVFGRKRSTHKRRSRRSKQRDRRNGLCF